MKKIKIKVQYFCTYIKKDTDQGFEICVLYVKKAIERFNIYLIFMEKNSK
ncbi:hypothetical protein [Clostridium polynesiense]|nr:hypothetical protein [Clostridium polynesiense]